MRLNKIPTECTCGGTGIIRDDEDNYVKCFCWYERRYDRIYGESRKHLPLRYNDVSLQSLKDSGCEVKTEDRDEFTNILSYPEEYLHGRGIFIIGGSTDARLGAAMAIAKRAIFVGGMSFTYVDWSNYFPNFFEHWKTGVGEIYEDMVEARTLIIDNFNLDGLVEDKQMYLNTFWNSRSSYNKLTIFCGNYFPDETDTGEDFIQSVVYKYCDIIKLVKSKG